MAVSKDQVCVLIPTLNEAPTVGTIVREFRQRGFPHILVMDGNSTDGTREIAAREGARVEVQSGKGKGRALSEAFLLIEQPYILMIDGDGTYDPADADRLLGPLEEGYDHVIGDRLTEENRHAFSRLNYFGNFVLNRLFKTAHSAFLSDILSGYRAFSRQSVLQMNLREAGFGIETEISAEAVRRRQKIAVVPISYRKRPGTPTKLNPFHDGFKIMATIWRLARMSNPLFYFGLIGLVIMTAGFFVGIYIIWEWLRHVEHLPLTILTVLLIIAGFQIFMFGILSDMMLAMHREIISEIHEFRQKNR
ncbi:MAG: S-layer glycoprotein N-glycosyltransferase AglJ [Methanolinea sp.]|nr:S-layer glycoprotein N-glycosyltransferase AglJ [Methanolinea sp.]